METYQVHKSGKSAQMNFGYVDLVEQIEGYFFSNFTFSYFYKKLYRV